ncbi:MAG: ADP-ribosylglycohydrolase family protein [Pseudomonadota bacterium]|nr:ADP-ribosylglycohydrolase family protein [Pseudomonadota bacterium]
MDEDHLNSLPGSSLKNSISDRARGSLIGTAVGDALGTTIEFSTPGTFEPVSEITGGGPFKLKAGEWTDDSSMMQCLAHSLTRTGEFDLKDQVDLYTKWWKEGAFSVTANCFDIGMTVQSALQEYQQTGNPEAGPDDPYSAGNEGGAYEGEWIPGGYTKAGTAEATMSGGEHIVHNNNIDNLSKIDNIYVEKLQ